LRPELVSNLNFRCRIIYSDTDSILAVKIIAWMNPHGAFRKAEVERARVVEGIGAEWSDRFQEE
jgi:hypothetical protein